MNYGDTWEEGAEQENGKGKEKEKEKKKKKNKDVEEQWPAIRDQSRANTGGAQRIGWASGIGKIG